MCSVGSGVRRGATRRAVLSHAACSVGQRSVLCEATRRAAWGNAACCVEPCSLRRSESRVVCHTDITDNTERLIRAYFEHDRHRRP